MPQITDHDIAAAAMKWFEARGQANEASMRRHILKLAGVHPDTWRFRAAHLQFQEARRHERAMQRALALECEKSMETPSNAEE